MNEDGQNNSTSDPAAGPLANSDQTNSANSVPNIFANSGVNNFANPVATNPENSVNSANPTNLPPDPNRNIFANPDWNAFDNPNNPTPETSANPSNPDPTSNSPFANFDPTARTEIQQDERLIQHDEAAPNFQPPLAPNPQAQNPAQNPQTSANSTPETPAQPTTYADLVAQNQDAQNKSALPAFLQNKIFLIGGAAVVVMIIVAVVIAATRPKILGPNGGPVNDQFVSLGTLLAYGKGNVANTDNVRTLSEASLVLTSAENTLSAKYNGIADASQSNQISDDLKSKLESAKAVSDLESVYHDQLKEQLTATATALSSLAKLPDSADNQAAAAQAAADFAELAKRISTSPVPEN